MFTKVLKEWNALTSRYCGSREIEILTPFNIYRATSYFFSFNLRLFIERNVQMCVIFSREITKNKTVALKFVWKSSLDRSFIRLRLYYLLLFSVDTQRLHSRYDSRQNKENCKDFKAFIILLLHKVTF